MWKKRVVTPSAVMVFFMEQRITPLVSPWSTTAKRELKLPEGGRSVMRLQETCWNSQVAIEQIGVRGGNGGVCVGLILVANSTPVNVIADKSCKTRPPELGGSQLVSFSIARMAGSSMVVAVGKNGLAEGKVGENVDTALVHESACSMLPV